MRVNFLNSRNSDRRYERAKANRSGKVAGSRRARSRNMSTRERSSLCVEELILSDNYNDMRQSSREEGENSTVLLSKRFINICFLIASS